MSQPLFYKTSLSQFKSTFKFDTSYEILEAARDGKTVAELMDYGRQILTKEDVMEGISEIIHDMQVETTFPDGTKLVTVHHPIQ